jgi:hypothetical protein
LKNEKGGKYEFPQQTSPFSRTKTKYDWLFCIMEDMCHKYQVQRIKISNPYSINGFARKGWMVYRMPDQPFCDAHEIQEHSVF